MRRGGLGRCVHAVMPVFLRRKPWHVEGGWEWLPVACEPQELASPRGPVNNCCSQALLLFQRLCMRGRGLLLRLCVMALP